MDRVRIVRHPQRICLKDILENVYDKLYGNRRPGRVQHRPQHAHRPGLCHQTGGQARPSPARHGPIGQEKGHGQEFRNGGSVKPFGNSKALHYMQVAATENIPIHTYVFTPGSYPIEDWPGAAQQIARNLYAMASLPVPIITVFSEGGSGGAEAIGLADYRLMLSHGYYSVISPEGRGSHRGQAARGGPGSPSSWWNSAPANLKMTAEDNLEMGYINGIVQEPPLGARPEHYDFFKLLRQEGSAGH